MNELRDVFRDVDKALAEAQSLLAQSTGPQPGAPKGVSPAKILTELVKGFVRSIREIVLVIPGEHYSGLSNQALLDVRRKEGRDFDMWNVQLKQYVQRELIERFRGFGRIPNLGELEDLASKLIVTYIASDRVLHNGGDVMLEPLTPAYAAWKRKQGKGGKPIGVFRGKWLAALRKARVTFKR